MPLYYGKIPDIPMGMTLAIYTEMDNQLSPPLIDAVDNAQSDEERDAAEKALNDARNTWKKISYAIAKGVVEHIIANMEIYGIQTQGEIDTAVSGETDQALESPYKHGHSLIHSSGEQENVVFTQSNDGTGHVR